jgi:small-conductance mechanosensitive channel
VFAPDAPRRRLIAVDDVTARSLASHLVWGTRALGALVLALAVHKALAAPAAMTIATNMLFALVIGALLLHLLLSRRSGATKEKTPGVARWLRGLGWLVLGVMAIALVAGYPTFGAFVAARLISISAILGGLYLLLALGGALFAERLAVDSPRGQELAADFGVSTSWLGFVAILTCAAMGLTVMLAALVLYIGPW